MRATRRHTKKVELRNDCSLSNAFTSSLPSCLYAAKKRASGGSIIQNFLIARIRQIFRTGKDREDIIDLIFSAHIELSISGKACVAEGIIETITNDRDTSLDFKLIDARIDQREHPLVARTTRQLHTRIQVFSNKIRICLLYTSRCV